MPSVCVRGVSSQWRVGKIRRKREAQREGQRGEIRGRVGVALLPLPAAEGGAPDAAPLQLALPRPHDLFSLYLHNHDSLLMHVRDRSIEHIDVARRAAPSIYGRRH
jgi:hypothetical protein